MHQLNKIQHMRNEILKIIQCHNANSVCVFGSCARGEETAESDVDLLVEFNEKASLFDLIEIQDEIQALLGCKVDVVSKRGLHPYIRHRVLSEAVAL